MLPVELLIAGFKAIEKTLVLHVGFFKALDSCHLQKEVGREIETQDRPIAFIPTNKACYQLWEEMRRGCSQGRMRSWGRSGGTLGLQLGSPPTSPFHHPMTDGGAGGAGERPVGVWGCKKGRGNLQG